MKRTKEMIAAADIVRRPFAWPGGYEKVAIMHDGESVCWQCVRDNYRLILTSTRDNDADGWEIVGVDIIQEYFDQGADGIYYCANCYRPINVLDSNLPKS